MNEPRLPSKTAFPYSLCRTHHIVASLISSRTNELVDIIRSFTGNGSCTARDDPLMGCDLYPSFPWRRSFSCRLLLLFLFYLSSRAYFRRFLFLMFSSEHATMAVVPEREADGICSHRTTLSNLSPVSCFAIASRLRCGSGRSTLISFP